MTLHRSRKATYLQQSRIWNVQAYISKWVTTGIQTVAAGPPSGGPRTNFTNKILLVDNINLQTLHLTVCKSCKYTLFITNFQPYLRKDQQRWLKQQGLRHSNVYTFECRPGQRLSWGILQSLKDNAATVDIICRDCFLPRSFRWIFRDHLIMQSYTEWEYSEECLTVHLPHEITWNANLMQQGNFIDVFLARHVSGTYIRSISCL